MRIWVFILLLANAALGAYVYFVETHVHPVQASADLNAEKMRLVPLTAEPATSKPAINGSPLVCWVWSSIAGADLPRAREVLADVVPTDALKETRVEGPSRYWVNIPPVPNPVVVIGRLRAGGVKDVSKEPDNSISLGLFSQESMAQRLLTEIHNKGFPQAKIDTRSPQVKEATLTATKGTSKEIASKIEALKEQFAGSSVQTIECPKVEKEGAAKLKAKRA